MDQNFRIKLTCVHCKKKLSVSALGAGKTMACPNPECGEQITIPILQVSNQTIQSNSVNITEAPKATTLAKKFRVPLFIVTIVSISVIIASILIILNDRISDNKKLASIDNVNIESEKTAIAKNTVKAKNDIKKKNPVAKKATGPAPPKKPASVKKKFANEQKAASGSQPTKPLDIPFDPTDISSVSKAAEQGNANAQAYLGDYYYSGHQTVIKNLAEAVKWYLKAAERGLPAAQFSLGWCFEHGEGVEKDLTTAIAWYRKAASQSHAKAQEALVQLDPDSSSVSDNPFRSAKVGQWAVIIHKDKTIFGVTGMEHKYEIIEKTNDHVIILPTLTLLAADERGNIVRGNSFDSTPYKIDLTKPFNLIRDMTAYSDKVSGNQTTFEIIERGREVVRVGRKKLDCTTIEYNTTTAIISKDKIVMNTKTKHKIWMNATVPIFGIVQEMCITGGLFGDTLDELKSYGER